MNEDDIRMDQIQRYLMGEMEAQELAEFQEELQSDPALAAAVALEEELQFVVQYQRRRELKTMLQNVEVDASGESTDGEEVPRSSGGMIRPPWKRLIPYVGGMAAIVIAAVFIFRAYNSPLDPMKMYSGEMDEVYDPIDEDRGPDDTLSFPSGYNEYDEGKYSIAYSKLDTTLIDPVSLLLHGISAMKMENFKQAARDFERLENDAFGDVAFEAHWYHALVDLHEMRYESSIRHLNVFDKYSPVHSSAAMKLKLEVEKLAQ